MDLYDPSYVGIDWRDYVLAVAPYVILAGMFVFDWITPGRDR